MSLLETGNSMDDSGHLGLEMKNPNTQEKGPMFYYKFEGSGKARNRQPFLSSHMFEDEHAGLEDLPSDDMSESCEDVRLRQDARGKQIVNWKPKKPKTGIRMTKINELKQRGIRYGKNGKRRRTFKTKVSLKNVYAGGFDDFSDFAEDAQEEPYDKNSYGDTVEDYVPEHLFGRFTSSEWMN